jgi:hypothetical protein
MMYRTTTIGERSRLSSPPCQQRWEPGSLTSPPPRKRGTPSLQRASASTVFTARRCNGDAMTGRTSPFAPMSKLKISPFVFPL